MMNPAHIACSRPVEEVVNIKFPSYTQPRADYRSTWRSRPSAIDQQFEYMLPRRSRHNTRARRTSFWISVVAGAARQDVWVPLMISSRQPIITGRYASDYRVAFDGGCCKQGPEATRMTRWRVAVQKFHQFAGGPPSPKLVIVLTPSRYHLHSSPIDTPPL